MIAMRWCNSKMMQYGNFDILYIRITYANLNTYMNLTCALLHFIFEMENICVWHGCNISHSKRLRFSKESGENRDHAFDMTN